MNEAFLAAVAENHVRYDGKIIVLKAGGEIWDDPIKRRRVLGHIHTLQMFGARILVINGGGKQITEEYARRGLTPVFENGERMCDKEGLKAAMDALRQVTNDIADEYNELTRGSNRGFRARPINGFDMGLVEADSKGPGLYTGNVARVNSEWLLDILDSRPEQIFIINSICSDANRTGGFLNVNADFVASAIAGSVQAARFLMGTTAPGIVDTQIDLAQYLGGLKKHAGLSKQELEALADKIKFTQKDPRLLRNATHQRIEHLIEIGVIKDGMIPKVRAALDALERGVLGSVILDSDSLLQELFTKKGAGTLITPAKQPLYIPGVNP